MEEPFSCIVASRLLNQLDDSYTHHLTNMFHITISHSWNFKDTASIIASAILMDAYPPRMHRKFSFPLRAMTHVPPGFHPLDVFDELYKPYCLQALRASHRSSSLLEKTDYQVRQIAEQLQLHFSELGKRTAAEVHQANLNGHSRKWVSVQSNVTCLLCIRRKPEYVFSCGHSWCEACVRRFGIEMPAIEHHFKLQSCILCSNGNLMVKLKPPTAGVSLLSMDGGGIRGIVSIELLALVQSAFGSLCKIQEMFDMVFGTSAGMLVGLDLRNFAY
jgi:hypothetical protein